MSRENKSRCNSFSTWALIRGSEMGPGQAATGLSCHFMFPLQSSPWMLPFIHTWRDLKGTLINGLDQCLLLFNHAFSSTFHISHPRSTISHLLQKLKNVMACQNAKEFMKNIYFKMSIKAWEKNSEPVVIIILNGLCK